MIIPYRNETAVSAYRKYLEDFSITSKKYLVKVSKEPCIRYTIRFIGCRKGNNRAEILGKGTGTRAEYNNITL